MVLGEERILGGGCLECEVTVTSEKEPKCGIGGWPDKAGWEEVGPWCQTRGAMKLTLGLTSCVIGVGRPTRQVAWDRPSFPRPGNFPVPRKLGQLAWDCPG